MIKLIVGVIIFSLISIGTASAKHKHKRVVKVPPQICFIICPVPVVQAKIHKNRHIVRRSYKVVRKPLETAALMYGGGGVSYLPHPFGCPSRAFCGCGAATRVFGSPVRSLWLAANWYRFPRTSPAGGMVAVRRHHVFVLESHVAGQQWLVSDYNSGRHASRRHVRSIAGYTIVNPHGGRYAAL